MKLRPRLLPALIATTAALTATAAADCVQLFNGKDLTGWKGQPEFWSVEDGAIAGKSTEACPVKENTFLIWQGGEPGDFELRLKYKLLAGNSGIQYRSKVIKLEYSVVGGYQADFEAGKNYSGILYEEKGRGILAKRGQKVVIKEGGDAKNPKKPNIEVTGSVGDSDAIQAAIKQGDWNDYLIIAKGNHLQHFINGKQTVDVTDETAVGAKCGVIAFQIHKGPPMQVFFKDIQLKKLK
jgi:hypothetical protein